MNRKKIGLVAVGTRGVFAQDRDEGVARGVGQMKRAAIVLAGGLWLAWSGYCANVKQERDISYAEPVRCKLDVKWPTDVTNFSTVVWFHGGGLASGERHVIPIDDSIAQVSVNYRLLGQGGLTNGVECIRDAAAAVAWTLEHIAEYGGDPKKVYVSGMSAGGYLTMMVGMAPQYLKERGHGICELAGLAPISDLTGTVPVTERLSGG